MTRLKIELKVINQMGFPWVILDCHGIFIQMEARNKQIPCGPEKGVGQVLGSLVAYFS